MCFRESYSTFICCFIFIHVCLCVSFFSPHSYITLSLSLLYGLLIFHSLFYHHLITLANNNRFGSSIFSCAVNFVNALLCICRRCARNIDDNTLEGCRFFLQINLLLIPLRRPPTFEQKIE